MKILLVDDELDTRMVAKLSLRQLAGFTVIEASNGEQALALAASERPDAIVLDVMMPDMDGPAVLARLRLQPQNATTPVVFLTAKAMPEEIARLQQLGSAGIYTKPFDPAEFANAMRTLLGSGAAGAISSAGPVKTANGIRIEARALQQLVGLSADGGGDLIGALIDLFESNTPDLLDRIAALSAEHGAAAAVERAAHTLKAGAATLGALAIADLARTIEEAARDGHAIDVEPILSAIRRQFGATVSTLRDVRARLLEA